MVRPLPSSTPAPMPPWCRLARPFEGRVAAPGVRPVAPDDLLALLDSGVATAAVRYTVLP